LATGLNAFFRSSPPRGIRRQKLVWCMGMVAGALVAGAIAARVAAAADMADSGAPSVTGTTTTTPAAKGFWVWNATTLVGAVTALAAAGNVAFLLQSSRTERNLAARPLLWARVDEEPDGVYLTLENVTLVPALELDLYLVANTGSTFGAISGLLPERAFRTRVGSGSLDRLDLLAFYSTRLRKVSAQHFAFRRSAGIARFTTPRFGVSPGWVRRISHQHPVAPSKGLFPSTEPFSTRQFLDEYEAHIDKGRLLGDVVGSGRYLDKSDLNGNLT